MLTPLLSVNLTGKLYCQLHFDRLINGPSLRRNLSFRSVSALFKHTLFIKAAVVVEHHHPHPRSFVQSRQEAAVQEPTTDEDHSSSDDLQSQSSAGTVSRFIKTRLSWPLNVIGAVCSAPRHLCCSMRSAAQALANHLRNNAQDYASLYELLSLSIPLLLVLQEVLLQIYSEPGQEGPASLQPLLLWLQENVGQGLV